MESEHGKLFVGGISQETSEEILKEYFSKYGEVKESQVLKDGITGRGRGFGFITFTDPSVVHKALQVHHIILGRKVEVKVAIPKGETEMPQNQYCQECLHCNTYKTKKIFVGGLPPSLTEQEFKRYFESFGKIVEVIVIYDKENNRPRGFGFITFDSEEAVGNVLQKKFHELNNKLVEVKRAQRKDWSSRHMCTYDTYGPGLGLGGGSIFHLGVYLPHACVPHPGYCYGYGHGVNPYGVGASSWGYSGICYDTFSGVDRYCQTPLCYGNGSPSFYPTCTTSGVSINGRDSSGVSISGRDNGLMGVNEVVDNSHGTVFAVLNSNSCAKEDCSDSKVPVITSLSRTDNAMSLEIAGAEVQNGVDAHSGNQETTTFVLNSSSNTNDDDGDAEVANRTRLLCIDEALILQSNGSENQRGADGQSCTCNSS